VIAPCGWAAIEAGGVTASWDGMAILALVTFAAAAINAIAGGGTILTFPCLTTILAESPARLVTANATSTLGLWPGALTAAWASRGKRSGVPAWTRVLVPVSVVGAVVGTSLVLLLPARWFAGAVPWLILSAAVLFAVQPWLASLAGAVASPASDTPPARRLAVAAVLQFLVAVYGGYFGAGIGILMLAVLGCLGLGDIHRLNALKNVLATAVNGTTALVFVVAAALPAGAVPPRWEGTLGPELVSWPHVAVMAVAAAGGGLAGTRLADRLPAAIVRRCVALIGFALAGYHWFKPW
jgi:uncharacterized membrane protein YfcA